MLKTIFFAAAITVSAMSAQTAHADDCTDRAQLHEEFKPRFDYELERTERLLSNSDAFALQYFRERFEDLSTLQANCAVIWEKHVALIDDLALANQSIGRRASRGLLLRKF
ncbi:MAG: hypothetical protein AAFN27_19705 [Pseudomonadota bacterium]